jgi:hypothetical protein
MRRDERALAARRGLARVAPSAEPDPCAGAEAALRATVEEVTRLDGEVEALSAALADFARRYERTLAAAFDDLRAAERLVSRLQALEDGLAGLAVRLRADDASRAARSGRGRRAPVAGAPPRPSPEDAAPFEEADDGAEDERGEPEVLSGELALKRLYRRLARLVHPDLSGLRDGELMARVNAAYARGDLTALEVMAERLGAGEPLGDLSADERLAHLERRTATLARIGASLARERDQLLRSDTARLRDEALRAAEQGRDHLAETAAEAGEEAGAAYADALHRLARVCAAARDLSSARITVMTKIERRGPTGARRAFDPLEETEIVRMGAARLERQRATSDARELARTLEARAAGAPFEVALALLAFFAEESGARPPAALASAEGWSGCWTRLRAAWPDAPELARMIARLPRHLVVGARTQGADVVAGVQLADAALAAGVRIALERESVAAVARVVLGALGPEESCAACGRVAPALHLLRTRGLDERHGLACAACGAILRSYWRYGEVDGLEALSPHALRLGLVAEATAQLAGTSIGFQMLPAEREALTAEQLLRRLVELYLAPYGVELARGALGVARGRAPLAPGARIGVAGRLRFTVDGEVGPEELLELLRARIERRFRPEQG